MTVTEFAAKIARRSRTGDITKLSMFEQLDVLTAANSALMGLYHKLPAYLREMSEGFMLPAPKAMTVNVTQFSTQTSTGNFSAAQIGQSIQIAGDCSWNQILGPQSLLNPYMGTTGAKLASVYGNALYSTRYPFDRIIGDPKFADNQFWPLANLWMNNNNGRNGSWLFQNTVGRPINWWVEQLGNAQGNMPLLVMRFAPAPDTNYAINVRMSYWPLRLLLTDIMGASTLTVPDQYLEKCLLPMAWKALMLSPSWKSISPEADNLVITLAKEGEDFASSQIGQPGAPNNQCFTPTGF
jgi:hypothetical protein